MLPDILRQILKRAVLGTLLRRLLEMNIGQASGSRGTSPGTNSRLDLSYVLLSVMAERN